MSTLFHVLSSLLRCIIYFNVVYKPKENDKLFLGTLCPHFLDEEKRILETDESIKNEVSAHQLLFKYISYQYGEKIEQPADISMLYSSLESIAVSLSTMKNDEKQQ